MFSIDNVAPSLVGLADRQTVAALMAVTLCALPCTTSAQSYFTAAVGAGRNDVECTVTRTCEKGDVAFKLLGGYRVAPWIAGEIVYLDFGEARRASKLVEDIYGTSAFGGGLGLHAHFASWTVTARVGAARVANERGAEWLFPNPPPPSRATTPKLMPYGGAAVGYRFSRYVGLAAAFDVTKSTWERSDGAGLTWNAVAATAGLCSIFAILAYYYTATPPFRNAYPTESGSVILRHLIETPESDRWMHVPRIAGPFGQVESWQSSGWNLQPATPQLPARRVFLTDGRAISYAESVMGYVKDRKLATIIGGPTAGTNGNIVTFATPGGFAITFTGMRVTGHDGRARHHMVGIVPDIRLDPTLAGVRTRRDELIERALAQLQNP